MRRVLTDGASAPFLALACVGFVASAPAHAAVDATAADEAAAEDQQAQSQSEERAQIIVTGEAYQTQQESPKSTRSVRDTPQTVQVITAETIDQQNLLTLRDMLSTVPGVTFGAAEGGVPPSDQINFRGYSATTDVTQDGVRDSAAYSRSDSFNLEQLEVVNGANSVYSGAGSIGGSINIVTKRPLAQDRVLIGLGAGTAEYVRGTVDANLRVNDLVAVRLNVMGHQNDVPGRDVEYNKRWGFAPSATIGIDGPTRATIQYLHQEDNNIPRYGVPFHFSATNRGPLPGVDDSDYFGYRNVDRQDIKVDQATLTLDHEFSDQLALRNLSRWQKVNQLTIVGPPQGTYCLANGLQPNGASCTISVANLPPATGNMNFTVPTGYYYISGPRGNFRDATNELLYNQLDLRAVFDTGAIEHTLVAGASITKEEYTLFTGNALRNADGTAVYARYPLMNFGNPNDLVPGPTLPAGFTYGSNEYVGPVNLIRGGRTLGEVENIAVYLFDAMKLGNFEINGGVRWEKNDGWGRSDTIVTTGATQGQINNGNPFTSEAELFSYRIGLVYKPIEAVSIYGAFGNSKTPSQSSVNGSCTTGAATGNTCNVSPESALNYEIGAKAELANGRLLLTAAAFRNERDQYRVASNEPGVPDQVLDGRSRVDGIALGAVGRVTPQWSISANYTYLKPELLQSVSDFCLANPGSTGCGNSTAFPDPARGAPLQNTPEHSGSIFTTYELPFGLRVGYTLTYQGSFAFNLPTAASQTIYESDDYWVHGAYLAYEVRDGLNVQLNVKNLTDQRYYTNIRNTGAVGWAIPGDGRSAVLSVNYQL